MSDAGRRRFARRLLAEHQLPPELADVGYVALRDWIDRVTDGDALSRLIEQLKAQPYRRGEDRVL